MRIEDSSFSVLGFSYEWLNLITSNLHCNRVFLSSFPITVPVNSTVIKLFFRPAVSSVSARVWRTATDVPSATILSITWISFTQTFSVGVLNEGWLCLGCVCILFRCHWWSQDKLEIGSVDRMSGVNLRICMSTHSFVIEHVHCSVRQCGVWMETFFLKLVQCL